jgi:hypothetical protein
VSDIDWKAIAQTMAADNARLCDRLITAEAVVEYAKQLLRLSSTASYQKLRVLIAKHDAGRPS